MGIMVASYMKGDWGKKAIGTRSENDQFLVATVLSSNWSWRSSPLTSQNRCQQDLYCKCYILRRSIIILFRLER